MGGFERTRQPVPIKLGGDRPFVLTPEAPVTPPNPTAETLIDPLKFNARQYGFTGNQCMTCGSMMMVRNGTCEKCNACGTTTGCS